MKIFSAAQIRAWDAFTIDNEPISSIELMERAATACFTWLTDRFEHSTKYAVFCGRGNNGGDGLAIARLLLLAGQNVEVYVLQGEKSSEDFTTNLDQLNKFTDSKEISSSADLPNISNETVVIDALFGTGLNKPPEGIAAELINHINASGNQVIAIDMPSGLFADTASIGNIIVQAGVTLSFQINKLAFMLAENKSFTGEIVIVDIGLHPSYYEQTPTLFYTATKELINSIYKPRNQFGHKYNFGHALLFAGSRNMMGAAVLCAKACLRSGAGLVTVHTEEGTQGIIQSALPEAITSTEDNFDLLLAKKAAIGIGPGLLVSDVNTNLLKKIISTYEKPIVIDASALTILAGNISLLQQRGFAAPVLTPHSGEFDRLFDKRQGDFERMKKAIEMAATLNCYIALKGHHTLVACPDGDAFFNTTGNAGMATAGSGDALTGILTGLLSQGYTQKEACILGVYLHGLSGDLAASKISQEALIAGDIIDHIGTAYQKIKA